MLLLSLLLPLIHLMKDHCVYTHTHTNKHTHTNTHTPSSSRTPICFSVHSLHLTHHTHTHAHTHTHTHITQISLAALSRKLRVSSEQKVSLCGRGVKSE